MIMSFYNYMMDFEESLHPKELLEFYDLYGKDKKAYEILLTPKDVKVDHRKVKWARRYLKAHGYQFVSEKEADRLIKEREAEIEASIKINKMIFAKFPVLEIFKL